jgi:hypothetical protein
LQGTTGTGSAAEKYGTVDSMNRRSVMYRKLILLFVVLGVVVGTAPIASAGEIISGIERRNPDGNSGDTEPAIAGPLAEDSLTFVDRTHEYNSIPSYLLGADYVMTANDDKDNPDYELDVTLAKCSILYLLIDNRVGDDEASDGPTLGTKMGWVIDLGFANTGDVIGIDESGTGEIDNWGTVYAKALQVGTITLYEQNDGGSRNMYGVAAVPEPVTIALLGLGALALRRRRK